MLDCVNKSPYTGKQKGSKSSEWRTEARMADVQPGAVEAVRRFNRFYTRQIGALREGLLDGPFSLTEARVIYELAQTDGAAASELGETLGLDAGYLSRILRRFREQGLIDRQPSPTDGRQSLVSLTEQGRAAFGTLNEGSRAQVGAMLGALQPEERKRLVAAMETVERVLGARPEPRVPYILRPHQPGDMGWVVHRHGVLYAREHGWDETFEALVAEIAAKFIQHLDPRRERCWIAEREGGIVGSVFLVKHTEDVAKLRLLLVEPSARGLGIGHRLVAECIRFARLAGYRKVTLWTNSVLHAARKIYEQAGFQLVHEEPHHSFGHDLVSQTWDLELAAEDRR
jgi:DNA-binding MarR family transcriptional regulator/N-acetylglutamate synthase-like GNAT family acetyltransferase